MSELTSTFTVFIMGTAEVCTPFLTTLFSKDHLMCYTLLCKVAENVLVKFMEYMYTLEDALLLCYYFVFFTV